MQWHNHAKRGKSADCPARTQIGKNSGTILSWVTPHIVTVHAKQLFFEKQQYCVDNIRKCLFAENTDFSATDLDWLRGSGSAGPTQMGSMLQYDKNGEIWEAHTRQMTIFSVGANLDCGVVWLEIYFGKLIPLTKKKAKINKILKKATWTTIWYVRVREI